MRVYLAITALGLAQALDTGQVIAGPGHAVTGELRAEQLAADPQVDDEELELIVMLDAARASLALLAGAPAAPARRLVLAADVPSAITEGTAVPLAAVVCAFVDEAEAEPAVRAALAALEREPAGDRALAALDAVEEHDLLWYDATELAALSAELTPGPS